MDIRWLEDFLSLCETGNFRISSERRCVSQPAFSRRLKTLEHWVGAKLFDRSGQPVKLTSAGKIFKPTAQEIVRLANQLHSDIRADKEIMHFSTLSTLAQIFIPAWLKNLQQLIDANQYIVKTDYNTIAEYFDALEENSVDFFVCYEDPKFRFHDSEAHYRSLKLGEESLVAVVCPNEDGTPRYWLPDGPKGPIPCLHTLSEDSPSPIRHHMENKYCDFTFKSVYESSISPTLKAMALEGFGLAWIPSTHIADDLESGRLVRAAEPKDDIFVDIVIYRCSKFNEPRVEKFWQVLLQQEENVTNTAGLAASKI